MRTHVHPTVRVVRPNPAQAGWVALAYGGRKRRIGVAE